MSRSAVHLLEFGECDHLRLGFGEWNASQHTIRFGSFIKEFGLWTWFLSALCFLHYSYGEELMRYWRTMLIMLCKLEELIACMSRFINQVKSTRLRKNRQAVCLRPKSFVKSEPPVTLHGSWTLQSLNYHRAESNFKVTAYRYAYRPNYYI